MKNLPKSAAVLSLLSLAFAGVASVSILAWQGSFPEPTPASAFNAPLAEARGWSAVTLGVALPILAVSGSAARRGSLRGRLAWLGALFYLVYTYLEFAVSPPFTALYLVYIAAFACALAALVMGVASVDADEVARAFADRAPRRSVAAFALTSSAVVALAWLKPVVAQILAGDVGWPHGEAAIGHVVHALDLGLVVPLGISAGVLLLRRRPAGYVAAAIVLVNSACMGTALVAMVLMDTLGAGRSVVSALPFAVVPVVAALLAVAFFRALRVSA